MDRNLSRRVEVVFPVEQPDLKARLIDEILMTSLADTMKARELLPDGSYRRVTAEEGVAPLRSQQRFLELAVEAEQRLQLATAGSAALLVPPPRPTNDKPKVVRPRRPAKSA